MTSWSKVGIIAGGGELPVSLAEACVRNNKPFHILGLQGYADDRLSAFPGASLPIGAFGRAVRDLKDAGCDAVAFVGIVKRPNFAHIRPDWKGVSRLPRVVAAATKGDDALLRSILSIFADEGFQVIGADEIVDDLVAPAGALTRKPPNERDMRDMRLAMRTVDALGRLDIGQGAVVCDNLVLAVEAAEGTDEMLKRCAHLPQEIRGDAQARKGVLLKMPKPAQERRIDLPVIGVATIENAASAGLAGVAVKAGEALMVQQDALIARADALGLFVYGFKPEELAGDA